MPISSLNSIFLGSFAYSSNPVVFCYLYLLLCLSVSASVPNPYIQTGTTQASNTFPFSCFLNFLSHIMPSTILPAAVPACILLCIYLLLPPFSHTLPHVPKSYSHSKLFRCFSFDSHHHCCFIVQFLNHSDFCLSNLHPSHGCKCKFSRHDVKCLFQIDKTECNILSKFSPLLNNLLDDKQSVICSSPFPKSC